MRGQRHLAVVRGLKVSDAYEKPLVAFLPEARGLAVATRDHGVVFTDTRGVRTARAPITRGSSQPRELAIDADGHWIAVAWTEPAGITVHDAASGALVGKFDGSAFALSPDGRWLARTEQEVVVLQPLGSGGPGVELGRHGRIRSFAFSADATMLAAASDDRTTTLWNVAKRQQFGTLQGHRGVVNDVAFSPDGGAIATVSGDYTARIWDTQTGRELATLPGSAWMGQVAVVFRRRISRRDHRLETDGLPVSGHGPAPRPAAAHRPQQRDLLRRGAPSPGAVRGIRNGAHHLGPVGPPTRPTPARDRAWARLRTGLQPEWIAPGDRRLDWTGSQVRRIVVRDADTGEVRTQFSARDPPLAGLRPGR